MASRNGSEAIALNGAAQLCDLSPRVVKKWFDNCGLENYTVPGTRERRTTARHLYDFLRKHGNPVPPRLSAMLYRYVVAYSVPLVVVGAARACLEPEGVEVTVAGSLTEVGRLAENPGCLAVWVDGAAVTVTECRDIAHGVRLPLLAIEPDESDRTDYVKRLGFEVMDRSKAATVLPHIL